jgi:hypothetical protein
VPGGPALALPPERTSRQVVVSRLGAEHNGRSAGAQVTGSGMVLDAGNSAEFALYSFNPAKSVTTLAIDVFSIAEPRYWVGLADYSRQRWDFSGPYSASAELGVELRHASPHGNINVVIIAPPGGQVEIASLAVSDAAPDNQPPHAVLAAPDADGPYPLSITLDGSLSSDLDGSIASYAWDLDGDGSFETDTGSVPQAQLAIPGPGSYRPGLRVADNLGATDIAEASSVTAHGWASQVLAAAGDSGRSSSLAAVNGRPAVTYRQVDGTGEHLNYAISSTLLGLAAGDWQTITLRSAPGAGLSSSLLVVYVSAAVAF